MTPRAEPGGSGVWAGGSRGFRWAGKDSPPGRRRVGKDLEAGVSGQAKPTRPGADCWAGARRGAGAAGPWRSVCPHLGSGGWAKAPPGRSGAQAEGAGQRLVVWPDVVPGRLSRGQPRPLSPRTSTHGERSGPCSCKEEREKLAELAGVSERPSRRGLGAGGRPACREQALLGATAGRWPRGAEPRLGVHSALVAQILWAALPQRGSAREVGTWGVGTCLRGAGRSQAWTLPTSQRRGEGCGRCCGAQRGYSCHQHVVT